MDTEHDIIGATDWSRTFHVYGLGTDAPGHLTALLSDDEGARSKALGYLYGALLHQDTLYPATVPAARFVAAVLDHPAADLPTADPFSGASNASALPMRVRLLSFLADVAEAAATDRTDTELDALADPSGHEQEIEEVLARMARGAGDAEDQDAKDEDLEVWEEPAVELLRRAAPRDLRRAAPELLAAVEPLLTHRDRGVRLRAVEAAGALAVLGAGLPLDLSGAADLAESREEGAVIVLALGDNGRDVTEFLTHADPAIRACAALAPGQRGNPAATAELRTALRDPATADAWFGDRLRRFPDRVSTELATASAKGRAARPADALEREGAGG